MNEMTLLLGVDGGGTRCRARLTTWSGKILGESVAGPANIRLGIEQSFTALLEATADCLQQAGRPLGDAAHIVACLALAGASEPEELAKARAFKHPFHKALITTDASAACVGAHGGGDGAIIIVGTGSIGWGTRHGRTHRVGGWGFPLSDEGSGAWLGREALRHVLWAHDGAVPWSGLLHSLFKKFHSNPHEIVRWAAFATPRDFGTLAPQVVHFAAQEDPAATEIMLAGARHIDAIATRLLSFGIAPIALVGGLGEHMAGWLSDTTRANLVAPQGDALQGALHLARSMALTLRVGETAA
jgi:glucosamine kinase